jgi:hypothetical protein
MPKRTPVSGLELTMGMGMIEKLMAESESGFMKFHKVFLGSGLDVSKFAMPYTGITISQRIAMVRKKSKDLKLNE